MCAVPGSWNKNFPLKAISLLAKVSWSKLFWKVFQRIRQKLFFTIDTLESKLSLKFFGNFLGQCESQESSVIQKCLLPFQVLAGCVFLSGEDGLDIDTCGILRVLGVSKEEAKREAERQRKRREERRKREQPPGGVKTGKSMMVRWTLERHPLEK